MSMGVCGSAKFTDESVMTHPDWQVLVLSRYGSSQQVVAHAQFERNICNRHRLLGCLSLWLAASIEKGRDTIHEHEQE